MIPALRAGYAEVLDDAGKKINLANPLFIRLFGEKSLNMTFFLKKALAAVGQ
jgi:hypothetical protein